MPLFVWIYHRGTRSRHFRASGALRPERVHLNGKRHRGPLRECRLPVAVTKQTASGPTRINDSVVCLRLGLQLRSTAYILKYIQRVCPLPSSGDVSHFRRHSDRFNVESESATSRTRRSLFEKILPRIWSNRHLVSQLKRQNRIQEGTLESDLYDSLAVKSDWGLSLIRFRLSVSMGIRTEVSWGCGISACPHRPQDRCAFIAVEMHALRLECLKHSSIRFIADTV